MKNGRVGAKFDEKYTKENSIFPKKNIIWACVILLIQIVVLIFAFSIDFEPQDVIHQYDITVEPREDGSLDIEYHFIWEALSKSDELTWIEIGIANGNYSVYSDSVSSTISKHQKKIHDGGVYLVLDLDRPYIDGEILEFSFKINQKDMLCKDENGYFYEFVPCWFNSIPIEKYNFQWRDNGEIKNVSGGNKENGYYKWNGSLECGDYKLISVRYGKNSFDWCNTVKYQSFDDSGAYNEIKSEKYSIIGISLIIVIALIVFQVWMVDSVVSYRRGRGFLSGYGYYIHIYGRSNPNYVRIRDSSNTIRTSGIGGGRSSGCACACACACAGGGRAGCNQKDTYNNTTKKSKL